MSEDPYQEEEKAEYRLTMLWCEGRLDDLYREGMIEGGIIKITEQGRRKYRDLVASGFQPKPKLVRVYLTYCGSIHVSALESMMELILHYQRT